MKTITTPAIVIFTFLVSVAFAHDTTKLKLTHPRTLEQKLLMFNMINTLDIAQLREMVVSCKKLRKKKDENLESSFAYRSTQSLCNSILRKKYSIELKSAIGNFGMISK